ncbi:MAG: hypothetical protein M3Y80_08485, partial [Verrucomicrobiota bacterium]|nr:hypothetical protein [Verrucomicrobiota bacterium]
MRPYADSNFFTRLYLTLSASTFADKLLEQAQGTGIAPLPLTWLHRLEVMNAFEQQVFASRVEGQPRVTSEQAA